MTKILIADDDRHIREVLRFALEKAGYSVCEAADGQQVLAVYAQQRPALIVLDIIMPEMDGLEAARRIRATSEVPIVFLSSRDDELDRILGLELGGDDYVTKPFSPRELVARVKAVLRRIRSVEAPPAEETEAIIEHGALRLDPNRHECRWRGELLAFTVTEFALLRSLLRAPGRVYSRTELVDRAYGHEHFITERTVDSHVRRIRKKFAALGVEPVETVYGMGYRLRDPLPDGDRS